MDGNEVPDDYSVVLGRHDGLPRFLSRLLLVACFFGLTIALAGGMSAFDTGGGLIVLPARVLLGLGLALVGISSAPLAVGWWLGRPSKLSAEGIRMPRRRGDLPIPWSHVRHYQIRSTENGRRRLLAVWLTPDRGSAPLWLGDVTRASLPEEEIMALVHRWTER
ncbi:hypothetical protein FRZ03_20490 [Streptomyces misionensis]|uniref:PH domain-containing protein n=1 Tax=Streptomyces misionensis TaxID=67331 RepID=A0A5C6JMM8_9ACTN|nr:hypothetical protein [Streptomyces misionensis]TWV41867.1 hypothetical protein FRZ03_20490 [Streptomyces misionensis]